MFKVLSGCGAAWGAMVVQADKWSHRPPSSVSKFVFLYSFYSTTQGHQLKGKRAGEAELSE